MIDHVSIPVTNIELASVFYDPVLETLGLVRIKGRSGAIGYGPATRAAPVFWILQSVPEGAANAGVGLHVSFQAADRSCVRAFYDAALAFGGRDAGEPGWRPEYTMPFYGAFVFDLDGYKIEAVCREPQ